MEAESEATDARVHIDRDWLKNKTDVGSDLLINKTTSEQSIKRFVSSVGGNDEPKLLGAIQAVVAQAQRELDATVKANPDRQEPYALLACREYYMQWRGRKGEYTATKRGPKGRFGLFLVRGCVRCPKGDPTSVLPAVFRIHAYVFKEGKRAESRYAYHAKKKADMNHIKCKDVEVDGNTHNPLTCTCCKHLYCTDLRHISQVPTNGPKLKAKCDHCEGLRWRRRSKSKPGEFTNGKRKEKDSYYEPIRKGMYFTSFSPQNGFTGDISVSLLDAYANMKEDRTTRTPDVPRRTRARLSDRTTPSSGPRAIETSTIETDTAPRQRGNEAQSMLMSLRDETSDGNGAFAQQNVPKIRLRALRRSPRRKIGTSGSFGRYV